MKDYKKVILRSISILSASLIILLCATFCYALYLNKINKKELSYSQISVKDPLNTTNLLYLKINKVSEWTEEDNSVVTAFDAFFINTKDFDFLNWEVDLLLPNDAFLENNWNCTAYCTKNKLIINSKKELNDVIKQNTQENFGFIIHSKESLNFESAYIFGSSYKHITKSIIINVLILILIFNFILLIVSLCIYRTYKSQLKNHEAEVKHDSILIEQTMKTFTTFIDNKDPYTRGHSTRVAAYTKEIARRLGFSDDEVQNMYYAGLMHDIGKITIADEILNKTSHLSDSEWTLIQKHTANGAELLKDFTILPVVNDAVLYHHERYDGNGYINRLKGEDIPLVARIVCVADSYDAMSANRCYRLKFSEERILMELERCAGKQFDPKIIEIMIQIIKDGTIYRI